MQQSSMLSVSMRISMLIFPIAKSQKKNEKKFSMEFQDHSQFHIYRNLMRGSHIVRNMSDLFQILSEDIRSQIWGMMHFSKEYRTSPQNKYVEVVSDIDSKKNTYQYWYEEKILANLQICLSKNQKFISQTSPLPRRKVRLSDRS